MGVFPFLPLQCWKWDPERESHIRSILHARQASTPPLSHLLALMGLVFSLRDDVFQASLAYMGGTLSERVGENMFPPQAHTEAVSGTSGL